MSSAKLQMIKWFFKWLFRLIFAAVTLTVVAVVVLLLSYNSILRNTMQQQIHARTGMDAEIGKFNLALASPTVEIQNVKIYNPPDFGGAPFLNISEIYIDYDRAAFARKAIHIKLLRINLAELDIVKNQNGRTNIFAFVKLPPARSGKSIVPAKFDFKKQTGYDFERIDALNVSIGKVRYIDLSNPQNDREQTIGIENWVVPNVKSARDLDGLIAFIDLRSNHFFDPLLGAKNDSAALRDILNLFGLAF